MSSEELSESPDGQDQLSEEALRRERDEIYERLLRTTAEFDNYRKRTDRERRELSEAAAADLIRDLLPVVDDLERALAAPSADVSRDRSGVELIRRQLLEVLRRRGVEPLDVMGRDFDPSWHEAVADEPAAGRREGEITSEIRRGYRIGQR
ncbi:MAG TPA: nucleotide exchange factor GrpE, partial [Candidatus Binatia bacterium]|nr:nucleotide exchange factor GrpE [Candidatus Binatia bacterium]